MTNVNTYKSEAMKSIHNSVKALEAVGATNNKTIEVFDKICLENISNKKENNKSPNNKNKD